MPDTERDCACGCGESFPVKGKKMYLNREHQVAHRRSKSHGVPQPPTKDTDPVLSVKLDRATFNRLITLAGECNLSVREMVTECIDTVYDQHH